jgi:hypothetical protein
MNTEFCLLFVLLVIVVLIFYNKSNDLTVIVENEKIKIKDDVTINEFPQRHHHNYCKPKVHTMGGHQGITMGGHQGITMGGHQGITMGGHQGITMGGHQGVILSPLAQHVPSTSQNSSTPVVSLLAPSVSPSGRPPLTPIQLASAGKNTCIGMNGQVRLDSKTAQECCNNYPYASWNGAWPC